MVNICEKLMSLARWSQISAAVSCCSLPSTPDVSLRPHAGVDSRPFPRAEHGGFTEGLALSRHRRFSRPVGTRQKILVRRRWAVPGSRITVCSSGTCAGTVGGLRSSEAGTSPPLRSGPSHVTLPLCSGRMVVLQRCPVRLG